MSLHGQLDVTIGDAVGFSFTVSNAGDEPVELEFRDGRASEFVVRWDGEEVWRWSNGQMFTQALWDELLTPIDVATYDATWEPPELGT